MGGRGVHRVRNYSPKNSFFYCFPFASLVICSACIFPTLQRLNTKKDLDWNLLIQLCFVNKKLRKTERISYSTGIHPGRGPPLKVFLFNFTCTKDKMLYKFIVYLSTIKKRVKCLYRVLGFQQCYLLPFFQNIVCRYISGKPFLQTKSAKYY